MAEVSGLTRACHAADRYSFGAGSAFLRLRLESTLERYGKATSYSFGSGVMAEWKGRRVSGLGFGCTGFVRGEARTASRVVMV